ncbi:prevent-host-death family protein [Actinopolymorpha cephalotaxi]|uniref:Prevent-host-death family protein n=1 Tax=Actinopolymorpha cephalotaxi TaxID=504797 RepID=A0A1I3CD10_9ACTN|nr:type II toxin-antitoxin system prevent-host-death family antitoxin [Actinopolymorpha cephalotaxi]NYH83795.1 prevent-host-death family protein [Actinopolymorpha cephalotaxi]SFH72422.1 prevent-host-death family protein [Actinopolymorpha cephalotaxi]
MSAAAEVPPELAISDARDRLADVVNKATYAGSVTYLTRRGRRVAAIVPLARAAADEAKVREAAVAAACRELWSSVQEADQATKERVRQVIDRLIETAEDAADEASVAAVEAEREAGARAVSWESLRDELDS